MKPINFSAGPSILPPFTFEECEKALRNFAGTGLSLIEVSHRSKEFIAVVDEAIALTKELLNIPEGYSVVFLQGGASLQFCMVPYNLLPENKTAYYLETGVWAKKAAKEAKLFGKVDISNSSSDKGFSYIPKKLNIANDAAYLHITTNNTIYGTQIHTDLDVNVPLIADMSSDIFSRPVDISKYDLIYAGAQKNLGPAGVTIAIIKNSILGNSGRQIPTMLNFQTHIEKESMFNTPPVFAIFASLQTLKWLKANGGLKEMEKRNKAKAELLYAEIDANPLFEGTAAKEDRSLMNVTFVMKNKDLESEFLKLAAERKLSGLKGHRDVGGFRASIYNAMPIEGVELLVKTMKEFATVNA